MGCACNSRKKYQEEEPPKQQQQVVGRNGRIILQPLKTVSKNKSPRRRKLNLASFVSHSRNQSIEESQIPMLSQSKSQPASRNLESRYANSRQVSPKHQQPQQQKPKLAISISENIQLKTLTLTQEQYLKTKEIMRKNPLFRGLEEFEVKCFTCCVEEGENFITKGSEADAVFILEDGELKAGIRLVGCEQLIGEQAVIYSSQRQANVVAMTQCNLIGILKQDFMKEKWYLDELGLFKQFSQEIRDKISQNLIVQYLSKGEIVVHQQDEANSFYIIKSGKLVAKRDNEIIGTLEAGEHFGESALLSQSKRTAQISVLSQDAVVFSFGKVDIVNVLGQQVQLIVEYNQIKWQLNQFRFWNSMPLEIKDNILQDFNILDYNNSLLLDSKKTIAYLYVCIKGNLNYNNEQMQVFGIEYLQNKIETKDKDSVLLQDSNSQLFGKGRIAFIENKKFLYHVDPDLLQVGVSQEVQKQEMEGIMDQQQIELQAKREEIQYLNLDDYKIIQEQGKNRYGLNYIATLKDTTELVIIKSCFKSVVQKLKGQYQLVDYLELFKQINIKQMPTAYTTNSNENVIYFIEAYKPGLNFSVVLDELGILSQSDASYYFGSLILCLEQLHLKYKVIHRNVNPNNIYITRKGTLILDSNFFMKKLEKTKFYTLYEINDYVAPEMLNKEGYSFNADLYSLGIVLYECFFGKTPYKFKQDPMDYYESILSYDLKFPIYFKNEDAKDFMSKLLEVDANKRISSYETIKQHSFFTYIRWRQLEANKSKPPFLPPAKKYNKIFLTKKEIQTREQKLISEIEIPDRFIFQNKIPDLSEYPVEKQYDVEEFFKTWDQNF